MQTVDSLTQIPRYSASQSIILGSNQLVIEKRTVPVKEKEKTMKLGHAELSLPASLILVDWIA